MHKTLGEPTVLDQLQHPLPSAPLLEQQGSSPKRNGGLCCCTRQKKGIAIIIGLMIVIVLICLAVVGSFVLLPLFSSRTSRSKGTIEKSWQSFNDSNSNETLVMNPMEPFAGNWTLNSQDENLDSFLEALGAVSVFIRLPKIKTKRLNHTIFAYAGSGTLERMFGSLMTSEVDIVIEGPTTVTVEFRVLTVEFRILIKTIKLTFQLDEEFEFLTVDGRNVMTSHSIEDGNFVTRERWDHDGKEKHFKIIRKLIDDQIVCYNYVDDVTLIQTYVRIKK